MNIGGWYRLRDRDDEYDSLVVRLLRKENDECLIEFREGNPLYGEAKAEWISVLDLVPLGPLEQLAMAAE